jgi:enamine deaminase RidA (YjgF/YER057c/UK114 family)
MGDRVFTFEETRYDERGRVVLSGARLQEVTFAEEVHGTFKALTESLALAGCALADVIDCQAWLRDPRDFHEFNRIYGGYFETNRPVRSVFRAEFMFDFRIEMKVVAYKPLEEGDLAGA